MRKDRSEDLLVYERDHEREGLPRPSARYRLRAWREFQRALDPLARPKPLRPPRF